MIEEEMEGIVLDRLYMDHDKLSPAPTNTTMQSVTYALFLQTLLRHYLPKFSSWLNEHSFISLGWMRKTTSVTA